FVSKKKVKQLIFYNEVITNILSESGNTHFPIAKFPMFFDGSRSEIILLYGTTALVAQLYEGGHTAHSLFRVPVEENNTNVQSMIKYNSSYTNLICTAKLIIWDELSMANKAVLDCIDIPL
ncbi:31727_t:CDS:2, partial [Gigaspora margarita]